MSKTAQSGNDLEYAAKALLEHATAEAVRYIPVLGDGRVFDLVLDATVRLTLELENAWREAGRRA